MPDYRSPYDSDSRRYSGDRPARMSSDVEGPQPGIRRTSAPRSGAPRSGAAPRSSARPSQTRRPAPQSQARRPSGSRPPQKRRPAPRRGRRSVQPRFFVILAVLVVAIVALVIALVGGRGKPVEPQAIPTAPPANGAMSNVTVASMTPDPNAPQTVEPPAMDAEEEEEERDNAPKISVEDQVQISPEQLHVNTSLPADWLNVLLLGTDERTLNEPARTDTMIVASINTSTGEVKLTSLLRDAAVEYTDLPKNNGTYRLNAANYFGGPLYAVKTVNELFDLNIQYYASVDFYGFTRIAEALGGIDVDLTEAERDEINKKQVNQAIIAATMGLDESGIPNEYLASSGPNTHLNGRQTLAYARVRYADNDYVRTERQRTVIAKLTEKLRGKSLSEIGVLLTSLGGNVTTNMDLNTVAQIAYTVLSSGFSNIETLRLPENGTYTLDRRNEQEMFYDVDWERNALLIYNFIYA